jgi:hypothetical protein
MTALLEVHNELTKELAAARSEVIELKSQLEVVRQQNATTGKHVEDRIQAVEQKVT